MNIRQQKDWIVSQLKSYAKQLADLRETCPHTELTHIFVGNCLDGYYKKYTCPECGDMWTEETDD